MTWYGAATLPKAFDKLTEVQWMLLASAALVAANRGDLEFLRKQITQAICFDHLSKEEWRELIDYASGDAPDNVLSTHYPKKNED